MADVIEIVTDTPTVVEVGTVGPQGPPGEQGPPGSVSGSIAWSNVTDKPSTFTPSAHTHAISDVTGLQTALDAAGSVDSVNGQTGVVVLDAGDVGAAADDDPRLSDTRDPNAHAASHYTNGSDQLRPQDIGAQSIFTSEQLTFTTTAQVTLSAARAKVLTIVQYAGGNVDVIMPQSGFLDGDVFVFKWGTGSNSVIVRDVSNGSPVTTISAGQQKRVQRVTTGGWVEVPVDTHTHTPAQVGLGNVSNTAQVTSVSGTAPIVSSGGTTPVISVTVGTTSGSVAAGDDSRIVGAAQKSANLSDLASASTARTNLGLGTAATAATGDFAAASHTHTASAISDSTTAGRALLTAADAAAQRTSLGLSAIATSGSASDLGSGTVPIARIPTGSTSTTVALGNHSHELTTLAATGAINGHVLTANGSGGVTFAAASGGVSAVDSTTADVFSVSGSNLVADDPNADRLVFWDDSASKLTHLAIGNNALSIDGTTLKIQPLFPVEPISRGATYIPYIGSSQNGNSNAALNAGGGFVLFAPVYVRKSADYTTFSIIVTTAGAASSLGKMALYTIKATDATPNALVCESGTFTTDSTGIKQPTMASTFVSEGWYYMAVGTNSSSNVTFYGDTMLMLRGVFSGAALNTASALLDYSQKAYANFWPNPWDGTNSTFRNAFHPITSLS